MHAIALVMLFSVMANPVVTAKPTSIDTYNKAFVAQFEHPVIEAIYEVNE